MSFGIPPNLSETVTNGFAAPGWLSSVSTSQGSTTVMSAAAYTGPGGAAGLLTGANLGSVAGTYQYSATYDALLRATNLNWKNGSATLFSQDRTFDAAGNLQTANTTMPVGSGTQLDKQAFCYDEQNRLTWAGSTGTPPCQSLTAGSLTAALYTQSFTYDTLGRLTASTATGSYSGPAGSYTYGDPAHLHAATAIGSAWTGSYDAAGNLTCRAPSGATTCAGTPTGAKLTFDVEGRLAAWQNTQSNPNTTVGFLYDNEGTRVAQQVSGTTTTTTVYVGGLEEVTTSGSTTTTSVYYYAGGQRIAEAVNGVFSYLASDGLGSADVVLNASGSATASQLFTPYGGTRYSNGTMPTDYGFTGQRSDIGVNGMANTGLDYYNARYYDPLAGQFTSADSILPGGGFNLLGLSRYAYVQGNPETLTDPSGMIPPPCSQCQSSITPALDEILSAIGQAVDYAGYNFLPHPPDMPDWEHASPDQRAAGGDLVALLTQQPELALAARGVAAAAAASRLARDSRAFASLAWKRQQWGLPRAGSAADEATVARLDVGGQTFYGRNASGRTITIRANAITLDHAETDAFQQALNANVTADRAVLYVDRALCEPCGDNGGIGTLLRALGIREVEVVTPQGRFMIGAARPSRVVPTHPF